MGKPKKLKHIQDEDYVVKRKRPLKKVDHEGKQKIVEPPVRPSTHVPLDEITMSAAAGDGGGGLKIGGLTLSGTTGMGAVIVLLIIITTTAISLMVVRRKGRRRLMWNGAMGGRGDQLMNPRRQNRGGWLLHDTREEEHERVKHARSDFAAALRRDDMAGATTALEEIKYLQATTASDSWFAAAGQQAPAVEEGREMTDVLEYRAQIIKCLEDSMVNNSEEELVPAMERAKCERQLVGDEVDSLLDEGRRRLASIYREEDGDYNWQLENLKRQCGLAQSQQQQAHGRAIEMMNSSRRALEYPSSEERREVMVVEEVVEEEQGEEGGAGVRGNEVFSVVESRTSLSLASDEGEKMSGTAVFTTTTSEGGVTEEGASETTTTTTTCTADSDALTLTTTTTSESQQQQILSAYSHPPGPGEGLQAVTGLMYFQSVVQRMSTLEGSLEGRRLEREQHRRDAKRQAEQRMDTRKRALEQRLIEIARHRSEDEKARKDKILAAEASRRHREHSFLVYLLAANLITFTIATTITTMPVSRTILDLLLAIPYYDLIYGQCHQPVVATKKVLYRPGTHPTTIMGRLQSYIVSPSVKCHVEKTVGLMVAIGGGLLATWILGTLGVENRARVLVAMFLYSSRSLCAWLTRQGIYHLRYLLALHAPLQLLVPLLDKGRWFPYRTSIVYFLLPLISTVVAITSALTFINPNDCGDAAWRLAESASTLLGLQSMY